MLGRIQPGTVEKKCNTQLRLAASSLLSSCLILSDVRLQARATTVAFVVCRTVASLRCPEQGSLCSGLPWGEEKKEGCLSEGGPGKPGCLRVRRRAGRGEAGSAVTNLYAQCPSRSSQRLRERGCGSFQNSSCNHYVSILGTRRGPHSGAQPGGLHGSLLCAW